MRAEKDCMTCGRDTLDNTCDACTQNPDHDDYWKPGHYYEVALARAEADEYAEVQKARHKEANR